MVLLKLSVKDVRLIVNETEYETNRVIAPINVGAMLLEFGAGNL